MFKEFALILLTITFVFCILFFLLKKQNSAFKYALIAFLSATFCLNIFYTIHTFLPDFNLDGDAPLGDSKENLFLYKSDSIFPSEVLFPVLDGRHVSIDHQADFFDLFVKTYSASRDYIEVSPQNKEKVFAAFQSSSDVISCNMWLIESMNYAFPETSAEMTNLPILNLQKENLSKDSNLIFLADDDLNIYLMSKTYYEQILREGDSYETN